MERYEKLKSLRASVNSVTGKERDKFLDQVFHLTRDWRDHLPNLRDIFQPEEIDWLLLEAAKNLDYHKQQRFIEFVASTGYKDEPQISENGNLQRLQRTTAVHHAANFRDKHVSYLFQIFNKFHVNYVDETGLSHFHVACEFGFDNVVAKFLDHDEDPNYLWSASGDSPLHLAVEFNHKKVVEELLRRGADPNITDIDGCVPLHIICSREDEDYDLAEMFFNICDDEDRQVKIDAVDDCGNTPLHKALISNKQQVVGLLLRRGANPNLINEEGQTPLHIICKRASSQDKLLKMFPRLAQLDVMDPLGRTPLQWAVENLMPRVVNILLDHGADLSSFAFPTASDFDERFDSRFFSSICDNYKVSMASSLLLIAENLENKGYGFTQTDALTIMRFFAKHDLFEKPSNLDQPWYDDEEFATKAKEIKIQDNDSILSLYESSMLTPEEEEKLLTYEDYFKFAEFDDVSILPDKVRETCQLHLCEMMSRGFFRRWALDPFWNLIHRRLPLECSEMVLSNLMNEDLYQICLAAAGQSL